MSDNSPHSLEGLTLPPEPVIELRGVSVKYEPERPPVLDKVDLTITRGSFTAITGPNGGGKTTLLRLILKLLSPTAGTVTYLRGGHVVKHLPIGYLPQKSMIDTRFPITVREVLLSGLLKGLFGRPTPAHLSRLQEVVELIGVGDYLDRSVGALSGGQLQRTLLGRAIISDPEVLVLDEPLSYVDKHFEQQIYGIIEQLARHTTILLVSHEMSVISGMATRHIIVDHGLHTCSGLRHYIPSDCL